MNRIMIFLVAGLTFVSVKSQKYKYETIKSNGMGVNYWQLDARLHMDEESNITDTVYIFKAQDPNYKYISNIITLVSSDNYNTFLNYFTTLENFYNENPKGVYDYLPSGEKMYRSRYGVKVYLQEGEVGIYFKDIAKIKKALTKYLAKNN